tara:strand:+ start:2141 stop:2404 length:264 start_codon:yes stop_codon:yes gene_type:complete
MENFIISKVKNKKYSIRYKGKLVSFGDKRYQHFRDKIGKYSNLNHNDAVRRTAYLKRAKGIKNKNGELTWKIKGTPNYYSVKMLWAG